MSDTNLYQCRCTIKAERVTDTRQAFMIGASFVYAALFARSMRSRLLARNCLQSWATLSA